MKSREVGIIYAVGSEMRIRVFEDDLDLTVRMFSLFGSDGD